jgi:hypothetical protein
MTEPFQVSKVVEMPKRTHCEINEPTPAPLLWMATARNIVVIDGILDVTQPLELNLAICQQDRLRRRQVNSLPERIGAWEGAGSTEEEHSIARLISILKPGTCS